MRVNTPSSQSSFPSPSLSLSDVVQLGEHDHSQVETNVVAVPGYHTPPVSAWGMSNKFERAGAASSANSSTGISRFNMYTYQPPLEPSEEFSWEVFLKTGNDLAEELARLATEFPNRPIIFVAHSIGGVLLRKALLLAHQNAQDPRFKLVVQCLSGILFMGTPHSSATDQDTLLRHNQVLYSCASIAAHKQVSKLPQRDVFQLANLAAAFEQIVAILVLSAIVDEQLATVSSQVEHLLGVHLSHGELCKLPLLHNNTYSAHDFLRSLLKDLAGPANRKVSIGDKWRDRLGMASAAMELPMTDTLNPFNLAPIAPLKTAQDNGPGKKLREDKPAPPTSLRLPLRLHLISNSSTENLLEARTSNHPCFMLSQSLNLDFVGRDDLLKLMDQNLLPRVAPADAGNVQSTRLFAVCGMGGIGKTDLAVEHAHSRRDNFDAIFWREAGGVSQLASDFGRIATVLGLQSAEEADSLDSSMELAKAWLTRPKNSQDDGGKNGGNWLLIFDNAGNLDVITNYVPYHGNGSVLVTSRDPYEKEHFFSNGSGADVEPLSAANSASLLRKLVATQTHHANQGSGTINDDEDSASLELANHLDGLPLAMTQMAGFIRRRHLSIREFMNLYANDAGYAEIHGISNAIQERRYRYTLATAYSFQGLGDKAVRLLRLLAFLNPDRVQDYIFVDPKAPKKKKWSVRWSASEFESARYELLSCSIIKRNIQKKELWIHRLIQANVRTRIDEVNRYQTFKDTVALLVEVWPPGDHCSQKFQRWSVCEEFLPHLERFYQLYIEYSESWDLADVDPRFPTLLNEAAVYLCERGFSHEGKPYLRLAISFDMHLCMGALSNETNDAQACLEHNILCLNIRKAEAAKGKAPDLRLAFAHSQMGIAYMMVCKFALATEYFKQSVKMLKSIDVDPDEFGFPVCNLGLAYWIRGELDDADKTLTNLLLQCEKLHGKLDRVSYKTGKVLHALGNVRSSKAMRVEAQGNHEAASKLWDASLQIHKDCLEQYESTLGRFNHRAVGACHKMAEHCIRRGENTMAQNCLDRALTIWGDRQWYKNESARSSFLRAFT
ncbi:tetratricopeptide repeat domain-containing protein [Lasiosphaeria ovina]|uniref:Tetratricopeptide repeat domain-containing protein n=1 Tax=Lasiosphaeria ovina TaxID=92902 RepID=A0AAE0KHU0_9PEZI|nr:tetratricopeptide repeat domain-containing protein [Lasiosphaeria ovina]